MAIGVCMTLKAQCSQVPSRDPQMLAHAPAAVPALGASRCAYTAASTRVCKKAIACGCWGSHNTYPQGCCGSLRILQATLQRPLCRFTFQLQQSPTTAGDALTVMLECRRCRQQSVASIHSLSSWTAATIKLPRTIFLTVCHQPSIGALVRSAGVQIHLSSYASGAHTAHTSQHPFRLRLSYTSKQWCKNITQRTHEQVKSMTA